MRLVSLIILAITASLSAAQDTNTIAKAAGKLYFGSATDNPELTDTTYVGILNNSALFGQITPGNSLKWDATEPQRGSFSFDGGDEIVNLAEANGQLVRGHTTVWHSQLPSWSSVVTRDKYGWDVVNEPFNEDGTFQSFVLFDTLGESYIDIALNTAREADPDAKLYINEFNIDGTGAKSTAMFNLVQSLQERGTPIDGIGIQAHLIVGSLPSDIQANFKQFASLGVEIAVTELDIRMTLPVTDEKLEQQRQDYQTVIAACNAVEACVGVTIWDYTDKYSWIPGVFEGQGAALPWDENFEKKPAYDGIIDGFSA
ncbi:glycoside hydrolase family 10 protein [Moniliophthora roreri MCA 2997]|uniref:Beta-xylanase n=1 Tax=Moniliophthora roreri (strain MCA 2997) TaxID=1381753 RepID=V2X487_MONRO|nr:glycoside hydrolase family 10 protein [Moniliophthora roreri MCA 2997]